MSDTKAESKNTTSLEASAVLCSICLDAVADDADRSRAKLQCGHEFHLDCIGSAFNVKGAMQCPNCRKVERGRWLFASGPTRSFPEISMDDWFLHEDQFGLSYPENPFNIHWCPFSGLARTHSAFEALESSPPGYHSLHRHPNMFAEHGPASSVAHSYLAYFRPTPSASPNTNETSEDFNFNYEWTGVLSPRVFQVTDMHYQNGIHHSHLFPANSTHPNSTDQAPVAPVSLRSTGRNFGAMTRSGSYMHPFLYGHGARSHERSQPSHTILQPHQPANPLGMPAAAIPGMARFHGRRPTPPVPANSVSDHNGRFFIFPPVQGSHETENSMPVISSDRDSAGSSFHNGAASDSNRAGNFWHGHWS